MFIEFEQGKKFASTGADISESHEAFKDAGWILEDSDYVVDIDTLPKDIIEKLIVTFNIRTQTVWTDRGVHFYFKKPSSFTRGANRTSPLGFNYEIKHKGNTGAVTIKRNGKLRQIENEGIREDAPFIFTSNKKYEVLYGLGDGEGRNDKLFALRSKLAGVGEWRKILNFINDFIFAQPLDEKEFEVVARDMAIEATKDNEYNIATWLLKDFNFVQYGERYYFKKEDGSYTHQENILRKRVYERVGEQKTRYVDEVIKQMQYRCTKIPQGTEFNIKFKNGYLRSGKFVDIVDDEFSPYYIDIEYDEEATPVEDVDNYINHLTGNDKDYRNLLLEILGHTLIVNPEFKRMLAKFFIFVGDGDNGKGTLLQIIKGILSPQNVTGMAIKELSDARYLPSFKGMLANLGDDIQDQAIDDKDMKILKNISTCDYISSRELYKGAESMFFTGSLIFTSNHLLKTWEKGKSYKRRVWWLPMFSKIKKKDPKFISKLTTEDARKYWLKLIVDGYMRLYQNAEFTESKIVDSFTEKYHHDNNPALDYIDGMTKDNFLDKPIKDVYDDYQDWCEDNAVNFNRNMISDTLQEVYGLTKDVSWVNGKSARCFVEKQDLTK